MAHISLWMIRPKLFICQTVLKSQTLCDMQSEQFVSRIEIIGPDGSGRGKVRWLYETKIGSMDLFFTPRPWRTSNCPVQLLYESFLTEVFFFDLSTLVDNHGSSFPQSDSTSKRSALWSIAPCDSGTRPASLVLISALSFSVLHRSLWARSVFAYQARRCRPRTSRTIALHLFYIFQNQIQKSRTYNERSQDPLLLPPCQPSC